MDSETPCPSHGEFHSCLSADFLNQKVILAGCMIQPTGDRAIALRMVFTFKSSMGDITRRESQRKLFHSLKKGRSFCRKGHFS